MKLISLGVIMCVHEWITPRQSRGGHSRDRSGTCRRTSGTWPTSAGARRSPSYWASDLQRSSAGSRSGCWTTKQEEIWPQKPEATKAFLVTKSVTWSQYTRPKKWPLWLDGISMAWHMAWHIWHMAYIDGIYIFSD